MNYEIHAERSDRAVYYAFEYGVRRAVEILKSEPLTGANKVRTLGGTAKRTHGLYLRKKHAAKDLARVREAIAAMNARRTGHVCTGGSVEIVAVAK
jgi:hypothetical protein